MILSYEVKIRPESIKRIEEKLCSVSEDEDVLSFNIYAEEKQKGVK